jgi:hypothetical protein
MCNLSCWENFIQTTKKYGSTDTFEPMAVEKFHSLRFLAAKKDLRTTAVNKQMKACVPEITNLPGSKISKRFYSCISLLHTECDKKKI